METQKLTNDQEYENIFREMNCGICGGPMYATDHGNHEITFHCASGDARFWDFERGSPEQLKRKCIGKNRVVNFF